MASSSGRARPITQLSAPVANRRISSSSSSPISSATTVRVRNGELLVSDGPFAETKELILGFDLAVPGEGFGGVGLVAEHRVSG